MPSWTDGEHWESSNLTNMYVANNNVAHHDCQSCASQAQIQWKIYLVQNHKFPGSIGLHLLTVWLHLFQCPRIKSLLGPSICSMLHAYLFLQPETAVTFGRIHRLCHSNYYSWPLHSHPHPDCPTLSLGLSNTQDLGQSVVAVPSLTVLKSVLTRLHPSVWLH